MLWVLLKEIYEYDIIHLFKGVNMANKFVYVTKEVVGRDGVIPALSVGILESVDGDYYNVNFVVGNNVLRVGKEVIEFFDPLKTGDLFPNKVCNVCHRFLPSDNFSKNQNGKGDRPIKRPSCDECRKIIDGVNVSAKDKRVWGRVKPNLEMFVCPICHKKTVPGLNSKVVLDHDHKTGRPRAWICDSCNTGLGRFKDEIDVLKNAIKYLETT